MASVAVDSQDQSDTCQGDEICKYVNSQFVTASEACWRIFEFDIHGRQPLSKHVWLAMRKTAR